MLCGKPLDYQNGHIEHLVISSVVNKWSLLHQEVAVLHVPQFLTFMCYHYQAVKKQATQQEPSPPEEVEKPPLLTETKYKVVELLEQGKTMR